jgi:tRNA(Arg) A34 adenosine deaminase TadA
MGKGLKEIEKALGSYEPEIDAYPDDYFALITCQEAFQSVKQGNYGIGSILVSPSGEVMFRAHNQVFNPYFRSDLHAEMVVMNQFEDRYRDVADMSGFTLYSSIEPCPMCAARLIASGVGTVKYVSGDSNGGMVETMDRLPPSWVNLSKRQSFVQAEASPRVKELACNIFMFNLLECRERLFRR